jgi:phosphoribosylaminoimidazole-succinocarboxamide synthase
VVFVSFDETLPTKIEIPELSFLRRGKVRDIYEVDAEHLLLVASDRISAFDCILPQPIPDKGAVLTQLSRFWFERFTTSVAHHLVTADVKQLPQRLSERLSAESKQVLAGRSMLVRRTEVVPFECVVRGYLAGSGWKEYQQTEEICGHKLPAGLLESSRLPAPIFTPATKAETGHDINIPVAQMAQSLGDELTARLEALSLEIYAAAAAYALEREIIICDTKFEFGLRDGELLLIDEVLTPDSSRFWPRADYSPGQSQRSFDKQYVRDYLETLDWNKQPPAPALTPEVVMATSAKYREAYRRLTGHELEIN